MISKPLNKVNQSINLNQQDPNDRFYKTVEAGDIALFEILDEAYALFGFTKVGKTCSCHILANAPMGVVNNNGVLNWKPQSTQLYKSAIVGMTDKSETQIPNIFKVTFEGGDKKQKEIILLDQPGYGDSYGFYRMFANGYFHYRTFSKTPKLKFILVFEESNLLNTGSKVPETILNFIRAFAKYKEIESSILKATSFLITKVGPLMTLQNICIRLRNLAASQGGQANLDEKLFLADMINEMVNKKRVFVINKPAQQSTHGGSTKNNILAQIHQSTEYWVRKIIPNNQIEVVDMKPINFSVSDQILKKLIINSAVFKADYLSFMKSFQNRIKDYFLINDENGLSLKKVIDVLIVDSTKQNQSNLFSKSIQAFATRYYIFDQQNADLKLKRQNLMISTFGNGDDNKISQMNIKEIKQTKNLALKVKDQQIERQHRSEYFLKKFEVIENIIKIAKSIQNQNQKVERSGEWLEHVSIEFKKILRQLNKLRKRQDSINIFYRYCYLIFRVIEEAKILTIILYSNLQNQQKFVAINNKHYIDTDLKEQVQVDFSRILYDQFIVHVAANNIKSLQNSYLQHFQIQKVILITPKLIDFFINFVPSDAQIHINACKIILKYSKSNIKLINDKRIQRNYPLQKCFQARQKLYEIYLEEMSLKIKPEKNQTKEDIQQMQKQKADKERILIFFGGRQSYLKVLTFTIFDLSNVIGDLLFASAEYDLAREIVKSVKNVNKVIKFFQEDLKIREKNEINQEYIDLLIQKGDYAFQHHRFQLAIGSYQNAYENAINCDSLNLAAERIVKMEKERLVMHEMKKLEGSYINKLAQHMLIDEIPQEIRKRIKRHFASQQYDINMNEESKQMSKSSDLKAYKPEK